MQAARLSLLLGVDFSTFGIDGHFVDGPELTCATCGKVSGLDDFVHTGLKTGAHGTAFMIRTLQGGYANKGAPHALQCCQCDTVFKEPGADAVPVRLFRSQAARCPDCRPQGHARVGQDWLGTARR